MPPSLSGELSVIPLTIQIVQSPQTIDTLVDLKFRLKVTNNGEETITLVQDPSGILSSRYRTEKFIVGTADDKNALPHFKGIRVKWSPEKAVELHDTIVIGPGQTTHDVIDQDLSRTYDFTAPGPGLYTFTPKNLFYIVDSVSGEIRLARAASVPAISVRITGRAGNLVITDSDARAPVQAGQSVTKFEFLGGTSEKHSQVVNAIRSAEEYIINCNRYLEAASTATPHYEMWFGPYVESLMITVKSVFSKIDGGPMRARYDFHTLAYSRGADKSLYSYVVSDNTICLGPLFWSAPLFGIDSQAGTIVHALTHFQNYGNTWDRVHGAVHSRDLAIAARHLAVNNADSFEYFAEDMGSNTASGLFSYNESGFNSTFVIPQRSLPKIFEGRFNVALPPFSSPNVVLVYKNIKDLTGSYTIQTGSIVRPNKIILRLTGERWQELAIFANITSSVDMEFRVTGHGRWNYSEGDEYDEERYVY